jgi:cytidyltransferase-like protein
MASSDRIVLCVGCFDPFHYGHLQHFTKARKHGDILIVGVTRDKHVNKGPGRPVFNVFARAAVIRALAIVDDVIHCDSSLQALMEIQPHVFALGKEYHGMVKPEDERFCSLHGIDIVFTDGQVFSSTKILQAIA